ncbi:MAG: hypothetical protein R3F21_22055 [Myxococcota bacterium]
MSMVTSPITYRNVVAGLVTKRVRRHLKLSRWDTEGLANFLVRHDSDNPVDGLRDWVTMYMYAGAKDAWTAAASPEERKRTQDWVDQFDARVLHDVTKMLQDAVELS